MTEKWQKVRLGEIADVQSGGTPLVSNKVYWNGDIPWYSSGELNGLYTTAPERHISIAGLENSNAKLFPAGSLLIGMYDTAALKMSILDRVGAFNQAIAGVKPNEGIDLVFILHAINAIKDHVLGQRRGVRQKNLSLGKIRDIELRLPTLPEQQRIVGILDEAFDGIATAKANAERNLQNARALFESHLQTVFTRRGEGWVERTIGEVCILRSGTTLPKELEKPAGEIPYLKVADMNISENLNGVTCSSRYVNQDEVNSSNLLPVGTTIFPKRGGAILTNKKRLTTRVICADLNIMGVTPKRGLLPEFLFNFFLRLDLREINNGSSIPQINNYSIEPLLIAFPESIMEQQAIIEEINSLLEETQRLESIYQQKLAALDELKKALLHQAFTGQL